MAPERIDLGIDDGLGHERLLNGVHSSSACPPIATVMADVAALPLSASIGPERMQQSAPTEYLNLLNHLVGTGEQRQRNFKT